MRGIAATGWVNEHHSGESSFVIDGFLFDLGNVLVNFSNEKMFRQIGALVGLPGEEVAGLLKESGLHADFERGLFDDAEFHRRFGQLVDRSVDRELLFEAASDIFSVNNPMVEIVRQLKRQGKRLVLLSNTCRPHIEWIARRFDVLELFDELVLSYEANAVKPDSAVYELAIRKLALPAERCLYTDDIADFVEAGRRHGLQGRVFRDSAEWVESVRELGVVPSSR